MIDCHSHLSPGQSIPLSYPIRLKLSLFILVESDDTYASESNGRNIHQPNRREKELKKKKKSEKGEGRERVRGKKNTILLDLEMGQVG